MATVLMSRDLKSAITTRIKEMEMAEMATYTPATPDQDLSPMVETLLWGSHLHLLDQLPDGWLHTAGGVVRLHVTDMRSGARMQLKINAEKAKLPPTKDYVPYAKDYEMTMGSLLSPAWDRFAGVTQLRDAVTLTEEGLDVKAKWNGVTTSITQLLQTARSLNEAVTAVPALRLYLPDDIKARLDTPVVKAASNTKAARAARAEALVAGIDTASIASSGVAGTLILGGKK